MSAVRIFRDGVRCAALDPADRGLAYGDGLFETLRAHEGVLPWWPRHRARLQAGAARLGIPLPDPDWLDAQVAEVAAEAGQGVVKLVLTRGPGGRGYAPPARPAPTLLLSRHPLPDGPARLAAVLSPVAAAVQPALAGLKHLNRLEQVLARRAAIEAGADIALMATADGRLACADSGNLLLERDGRLFTPRLDGFGVAGVCRGWLLEQGLVAEAVLKIADLHAADSVSVCNAVRGILPLVSLEGRPLAATPALASLIERLGGACEAFAGAGPATEQ